MKASVLSTRKFLDQVMKQVRHALPPKLREFRVSARRDLLKIYYGHHRLHYEVWANARDRHIEIGLHFEDGPESTAAYLAYFDARIVEIKHLLGPQIELERWTTSWGHLFESERLAQLDRRFAETVASRLAAQIATLQPMVEEAAVPPEPRDQTPGTRGRWRQRARR